MSVPNLCEAGTVLFVGLMPPEPGGTPIVGRNLLSCFAPSSIVVATAEYSGRSAMLYEPENQTHEILRSFGHSTRVNQFLFDLQVPIAARSLARLAREIDARVIIGSYPTFHLLDVVRRAAKRLDIPWVAYLHDTLAETTHHLPQRERILRLQNAVFDEASHVFVMSEGMAELYRVKYPTLQTTALEHIYPLSVRTELPRPPSHQRMFWGGSVYDINQRSFGRVADSVILAGTGITMTSPQNSSFLQAKGINTSAIDHSYYPDWNEYHSTLSEHETLLLTLDWPDESEMHRDELATIFPTKTPEYLATGRPILVHCPEDYFLAKFFREHKCGTVVSERSLPSITEAIKGMREGGPEIRAQCENALNAVSLFRPERIAGRAKAVVDAVSNSSWGQRAAVDL
jgi:hypothetical protein